MGYISIFILNCVYLLLQLSSWPAICAEVMKLWFPFTLVRPVDRFYKSTDLAMYVFASIGMFVQSLENVLFSDVRYQCFLVGDA